MTDWDKSRLAILDSLARSSLEGEDFEVLFSGLCATLIDAGLDIARAHISTTALHPLVNAVGVTWNPHVGAVRENYEHGGINKQAWQQSPFSNMLRNGLDELHVPLATAHLSLEFPVLAAFRDAGLTDWIAFRRDFSWAVQHLPLGGLGMVVSWASKRPLGFGEVDRRRLRGLTTALAAAVKSRVVQDLSHDVLVAYLGADAASKVMAGAITRGTVTDISAAIMMADMRDFTARSEGTTRVDLVALLNATFDAAAQPIAAANGQILKFMGDGFLAIFLTKTDRGGAMRAALRAAQEIQLALPQGVEMDIALHVGDVHYGNIGAAHRLDFTVIGSAVNEVARIEGLCSKLGEPVLVSEEAAHLIGLDNFVTVGAHALKGVSGSRLVYAPRDRPMRNVKP